MTQGNRATPRLVAAILLLCLLASAGLAAPASAATDIQAAGRNLGNMLKTWAAAGFGGVTAIMGVFYLLSRRIAPALTFLALALIVGGFVFAPGEVSSLSSSLYKTVLGG